jgi:hypothetical protein
LPTIRARGLTEVNRYSTTLVDFSVTIEVAICELDIMLTIMVTNRIPYITQYSEPEIEVSSFTIGAPSEFVSDTVVVIGAFNRAA